MNLKKYIKRKRKPITDTERAVIMKYLDSDKTTEWIAEKLKLVPTQVAAVKAHMTMKTYGGIGKATKSKTVKPKAAKSNMDKMPIAEFIKFCKKHNIKTQIDYVARAHKLSDKLPAVPDKYYKNKGWSGWGAITKSTKKSILPLDKFIKFCKKHKCVSELDYKTRVYKLSDKLPANPKSAYKNDGWFGWGAITGSKLTFKQFSKMCKEKGVRSYTFLYDEFVAFCKKHNCTSWLDYRNRIFKLSDQLPANPAKCYKNWKGWRAITGK